MNAYYSWTKVLLAISIAYFVSSCHYDFKTVKNYELYFDDSTTEVFKKGVAAVQKNEYQLADSLLTVVINNPNNKISRSMPRHFNPYFFRGMNSMDVGKYEQVIADLDHVVSDTTTDKAILMARSEAFKMLKQYDTCIAVCNKILALKYDSAIALSQRGVCYYMNKQMDKACADLNYCKKLRSDTVFTSFINQFLKDCK